MYEKFCSDINTRSSIKCCVEDVSKYSWLCQVWKTFRPTNGDERSENLKSSTSLKKDFVTSTNFVFAFLYIIKEVLNHAPVPHVKLIFPSKLIWHIEQRQSATWDKDDLYDRLMQAEELLEIYPAAEVRRYIRNLREYNITGEQFVNMSVSDFMRVYTPEKLSYALVHIGEYFKKVLFIVGN